VRDSHLNFLWHNRHQVRSFGTGICLHGHTLHSEECLSFLPRYLHRVPGVSQIVNHYEQGREQVDFARAYWTPPLNPASALQLEREQIAKLGLRPLVSLTDHDNIEAGCALQVAADPSEVPISVEWTVPYRNSIFHLGIHNLPPATAQTWMSAMAAYTASQDKNMLGEILSACHATPEILVVLNHPFWLEEGVEESQHRRALDCILREYIQWFHALELNGTRGWVENKEVIALAQQHSRPIISGGDRHACEPAACLNLTNSSSFSEFSMEVRDGRSSVLFLPHYRQPMALRVFEAVGEILREYPEFPGRERWIDRVFYRTEDGPAQSLATLWENREHWVVRPASGVLQFLATARARTAMRQLICREMELLP
jgi:hypothetical protein